MLAGGRCSLIAAYTSVIFSHVCNRPAVITTARQNEKIPVTATTVISKIKRGDMLQVRGGGGGGGNGMS